MNNSLLHDKASELRQRATSISQAIQLLDNSELDLAPEVNRVELSQARLPGISGGTFCGQAMFSGNGDVMTVGVRQNSKDCVDLIIRREGCTTRVTERRYLQGRTLMTVTAVFGQGGALVSYEEIF